MPEFPSRRKRNAATYIIAILRIVRAAKGEPFWPRLGHQPTAVSGRAAQIHNAFAYALGPLNANLTSVGASSTAGGAVVPPSPVAVPPPPPTPTTGVAGAGEIATIKRACERDSETGQGQSRGENAEQV
ncbi:hypothetical protein OSTOST_10816 [Ostertagia ostertagi]